MSASTRQRGMSLVEMALVLVLMGMVMLVTMQSQSVIEQYRQSQFVNQVRTLESGLHAYRNQHRRWPGDCNKDGLLDYDVQGTESADAFDFTVPSSFVPAANANTDYVPGTVCPQETLDPYSRLNVAYNELKLGGQAPSTQPNRLMGVHKLGGVAILGRVNTFNAIVLTGVPIASAKKLAVAIDGFDGSEANQGRIRRTETGGAFAALWTASGETEDKLVSVAVFFDRMPPVAP